MDSDQLRALWEDPKHWSFWRYRCPEDPRPMVPKRGDGIGWAINTGHRRWKSVMTELVLIILVPVFVAVALAIAAVWVVGEGAFGVVISVLLVQAATVYGLWKTFNRCEELASSDT